MIFDEVISTTGGSALVVATNLAYPLADLLLLALVVAMFALTGWRVDRTWGLVAAGFAVFAIADSVYLYETAVGTYVEGGTLDVGWSAALVLIACSAWQPTTKLQRVRTESWQALTLPTFFAVVGLALLVYDHFVRINVIAFVLASATIAAVIVRAVLAFRERVRLLATSQEEALSDSLTGLGNRRRFVSDLETLLVEASSDDPVSLTVFDLDGFKTYNDSFGHAAGDALLARVAGRLADATHGSGAAYRLGGDEFCVLASAATAGPGSLVERSAAALSEEGEGFSVRCSYGSVLMPLEASNLTEALRIADDRMYLHKQRNRPNADRQSIDVLVGVLNERDSAARAAPGGRRRPRGGREPGARGSRAAAASAPPGCRAARRGQARNPGGDPQQAGPALRGRVGVRPPAHADRRANPGRGARARSSGEARSLDPRALGRDGLPGRAGRPGDPSRRADHRRLRRVRRDDVTTSPRRAAQRRARDSRALPLRRDAVRP